MEDNKLVNFEELSRLTEIDKKTLLERTLKLSEEAGEVAQAMLSYSNACGCGYKKRSKEDLVEEPAVEEVKKEVVETPVAETTENSFIPSQFTNPANPAYHRATPGPEIWADTDGKVDIFVAGVGTGGTLTGTGEYLKSQNPNVKVVAVEPQTSPVLSEGHGGPHKIQGIGAGFVPDTLDTKVYDEILPIANEAAFSNANDIAKTEGILVGISSGAALAAAIELAKREENAGKTIVALFPDTGERYLSTGVFNS